MFFSRGRGDRSKAMSFMRIYRSVVNTIGFPEDADYDRILFEIRVGESSSDVFIQMVLAIGLHSTPGLLILRKFSDEKFNNVDIHKMMNRRELLNVFDTLEVAMSVLEGVRNNGELTSEPETLFNSFRNYTIAEIKSRKGEKLQLEDRLRPSLSRKVPFEHN